jgi:uncharacterized delta-60 repeat protein
MNKLFCFQSLIGKFGGLLNSLVVRTSILQRFIGLSLVFLSLTAIANAAPGDLDPTFGNGGKVVDRATPDTFVEVMTSVNEQWNGKIIVGGKGFGSSAYSFLARYNQDGTIDNSYGSQGRIILTAPNLNTDNLGNDAVLQFDGKIVAVGLKKDANGKTDMAVYRFKRNGAPDQSFGTNGLVVIPFDNFTKVFSVVSQFNGKIVIGGEYIGAGNVKSFALSRLNCDGSIDTSFGNNGRVITNFGAGSNAVVNQLTMRFDGKIIAVGQYETANGSGTVVAQYTRNGRLDTNFGQGGSVILDEPAVNDKGYSVKVLLTGQIMVTAGVDDTQLLTYIYRLQPNGSLDTNFGVNGRVTFNTFVAEAFAVQYDFKFLAGGYNNNVNFDLTRLNYNGTLDGSFGNAGTVITPSGSFDFWSRLKVLRNGKILAVGSGGTPQNFSLTMALYQAY